MVWSETAANEKKKKVLSPIEIMNSYIEEFIIMVFILNKLYFAAFYNFGEEQILYIYRKIQYHFIYALFAPVVKLKSPHISNSVFIFHLICVLFSFKIIKICL